MKRFLLALSSLIFTPLVAFACDLCAVYNSLDDSAAKPGTVQLGLATQFTHFESNVRAEGLELLPGQHVESSINQLFMGYRLSERWSLQLNVPLIYRDYRRVVNGLVDEGSESGLGDIAVLADFEAYRSENEDELFLTEVFFGLKLPTGDSDMLRDEAADFVPRSLSDQSLASIPLRHGNRESGALVGGDDLTLGSGSVDVLFGSNLLYQRSRFLFRTSVQFALRTEGDHDYRFGNDIQWNAGPGYFLHVSETDSLALRLRISGEHKLKDKIGGRSVDGSEENTLFAGPELRYMMDNEWSFRLASEFAVYNESAAEGVVPRYRVLGALEYRFAS